MCAYIDVDCTAMKSDVPVIGTSGGGIVPKSRAFTTSSSFESGTIKSTWPTPFAVPALNHHNYLMRMCDLRVPRDVVIPSAFIDIRRCTTSPVLTSASGCVMSMVLKSGAIQDLDLYD